MTDSVTKSVQDFSSLSYYQTRSLQDLTTQYTAFPDINETSTMDPYKFDCNPKSNPWCGQFGFQQFIEIAYLTILTLLGIFGNLLVIFSIILEKKTHKNGNLFISSLAVADFLAAGIYTPFVIANVIAMGLGYPLVVCKIMGYLIIIACGSSMWNLAFIALNRYIAITHSKSYSTWFSKTNTWLMVIFTWTWSAFIASPTQYGWTTLTYDQKSMVCTWDDSISLSYSVFIILGAILLPLAATIYLYWKLFWHVRRRSKLSRRFMGFAHRSRGSVEVRRKTLQREINLLKTLATAVIAFVLCWTPYSFCLLINPTGVPAQVKKICVWLGLQNSALNFIIYGFMNQGYRDGYRKLFNVIMCRSRGRLIKNGMSKASQISNNVGINLSIISIDLRVVITAISTVIP